jgi:hypothetical protein
MTADLALGIPGGMLSIVAILLSLLGVVLFVSGVVALFRARPLGFTVRVLSGALLLALGGLAGSIAVGVQGYRALTAEELAAHIAVRPLGPQRFEATLRLADGSVVTRELSGDEIYVDAHILKWKPAANLLGLHTLWSLDRVAGRYRSIEQERAAPRTVHALAPDRMVDLFELRRRYAMLAPLYDAEYGSASFLPVTGPAELELKVGTNGLLLRALPPAQLQSYPQGQAAGSEPKPQPAPRR